MPNSKKTVRDDFETMRSAAISGEGRAAIATSLNALVADLFALYVKTKNFHWHMMGAHFRDYHLLLDEQASQLLATIDPAAERVRKLGQATLRSIGGIARLQRIADNDSDQLTANEMLAELRRDNMALATALRGAHELSDRLADIATASLIENWVDEAEGRIWFLAETAG